MKTYYEFQWSQIVCSGCGWQGAGSEASLSEMFEGGAEYVCPKCAHDFGFVALPTGDEVRSDPRASSWDRELLRQMDERAARFAATKLTSPVQLPPLDPPPVTLAWDVVAMPGGDDEVHVLLGDRVIWCRRSGAGSTCWAIPGSPTVTSPGSGSGWAHDDGGRSPDFALQR